METLLTKTQKLIALVLGVLLIVVVALSTVDLGFLIAQDIWKPPRFLIPVQGLLEIFSFFLVILIGVELLETLKAYVKKDVIHVRLVLEVALIAMARKSHHPGAQQRYCPDTVWYGGSHFGAWLSLLPREKGA